MGSPKNSGAPEKVSVAHVTVLRDHEKNMCVNRKKRPSTAQQPHMLVRSCKIKKSNRIKLLNSNLK